MSNQKQLNYSFPRIAESMSKEYSIGDLYLRPFGLFETDLEVNFSQMLRPYLAIQILQCCTVDKSGRTTDQSFFWDLPVGKRIECLLLIATSSDSTDLHICLRCLNQKTCNQQMEIDISPEDLVNLQHQADNRENVTVQIDDETLRIRKTTGKDQIDWLGSSFSDEDSAIEAMIRTLVSYNGGALLNQEGPLPEEWIRTFNIAMEEFDPLINFTLLVRCPYCEKQNRYEIDLEELILRKLRRDQQALIEVVHRLAIHYHWSEGQILSIPSWRRSQYLALIEKEEDL